MKNWVQRIGVIMTGRFRQGQVGTARTGRECIAVHRHLRGFFLSALACVWLATPGPAAAEPWSFLVYGDSRGVGLLANQVNTTILAELARATTNEQAVFVLVPGDLVYSGAAAAFSLWIDTMAPVYDAGIGVYPVMGNHDANAVAAWVAAYGAGLPDNGPAGEEDRTYYVVHDNVLVLALDSYVQSSRVNQSWIDGVLASNTMPHVFAFAHQPAFKVDHSDTLDDYPADRNTFWNSLAESGARLYFAGHDHFYDHCRLDDGDGDPSDDLYQYIVGTAGAPLRSDGVYDGDNGSWTPQRVEHEQAYGYLVVTIDRLDVTATWKHRTAADTFVASGPVVSYSVPPRPATLEIVAAPLTDVELRMADLTPSASNVLERCYDLVAGAWANVHTFTTMSNAYDWTGSVVSNPVYFRIRSW